MAGLPASSAIVCVGPPLSVSAPSNGLVLLIEPLLLPQPQVVPSSMLLPPLVIVPLQFPPAVLFATTVSICLVADLLLLPALLVRLRA